MEAARIQGLFSPRTQVTKQVRILSGCQEHILVGFLRGRVTLLASFTTCVNIDSLCLILNLRSACSSNSWLWVRRYLTLLLLEPNLTLQGHVLPPQREETRMGNQIPRTQKSPDAQWFGKPTACLCSFLSTEWIKAIQGFLNPFKVKKGTKVTFYF